MIVQVHTDRNIESSDRLTAEVEASVTAAVGRFGERVSRVQVHLGDENSHKQGHADKRCMMEARLNGTAPLAVVHHAQTLDQAVNGAAGKLERSIDAMLGRLDER